MRVVIPYKATNNNDLYWAVKSIEKNYLDLSEIIIVGDRPPFDFHGQWIDCRDTYDKEFSIYTKLARVPGEVLFTNDDIFFLQPVREIPNYYKGLCGDRVNSGDAYYRRMYRKCPAIWLDFDVHCPMVINTDIFQWMHGRPLKSQYGNSRGLIGTFTKDFKIKTIEELALTRPFLSITTHLSKIVEPVLRKLFA